MKDLKVDEDLMRLISNAPVCVLQFGDESCPPCAALRGKLERWMKDHPEMAVRYIPIREFPMLSAQMGIFSVPTILVYIQGKLTARESGYFSLEQLLDRLQRTLALLDFPSAIEYNAD